MSGPREEKTLIQENEMAERYGDENTPAPASTARNNPDEVEVVLTRQWQEHPVGHVVRVSKIQARSLVDNNMGDESPEAIAKAKAAKK